jgi:hypothetical protein
MLDKAKKAEGVAQVVKHKPEALSSSPSTGKQNKTRSPSEFGCSNLNSVLGVRLLTDSKMATPLAPMLPLGVTPRPPINPAHRSLGTKSISKDILKKKTFHLALRF